MMNIFDKAFVNSMCVKSVKPSYCCSVKPFASYSIHRNCSRFVRASRVRGSAAVLMNRTLCYGI